MTDIVGVLLAAGSARRFGAHKLMHPLADGTPVAVAAARALVEVLPKVVAVLRPGDQALATALAAAGVTVVDNPRAEQGMGSSLAAGVKASPDAAGWLIALGDMPWIQSATIQALAERLRAGASLVAPRCAGRRGHPVGFEARWGGALGTLTGDQGARELLRSHADELQWLDTEDSGVLADIDHPADLRR